MSIEEGMSQSDTTSINPQSINPKSGSAHRSFLLRCWREQGADQNGWWGWRFSVREVMEQPQEYVLSTPGELLDFLLVELGIKSRGR